MISDLSVIKIDSYYFKELKKILHSLGVSEHKDDKSIKVQRIPPLIL